MGARQSHVPTPQLASLAIRSCSSNARRQRGAPHRAGRRPERRSATQARGPRHSRGPRRTHARGATAQCALPHPMSAARNVHYRDHQNWRRCVGSNPLAPTTLTHSPSGDAPSVLASQGCSCVALPVASMPSTHALATTRTQVGRGRGPGACPVAAAPIRADEWTSARRWSASSPRSSPMPAQSVDPRIDEERQHEAVEGAAHDDAREERERRARPRSSRLPTELTARTYPVGGTGSRCGSDQRAVMRSRVRAAGRGF